MLSCDEFVYFSNFAFVMAEKLVVTVLQTFYRVLRGKTHGIVLLSNFQKFIAFLFLERSYLMLKIVWLFNLYARDSEVLN